MRLSEEHAAGIARIVRELAGDQATVRIFGSRLDDAARGGDLDLLLELDSVVENPAMLASNVSARVSRLLGGRKVDVLVTAPNLLKLPIHGIALREGGRL